MSEMQKFTLIFAGDLRKVEGNPFTIKTPFGVLSAAGFGDALERADILRNALDAIIDDADTNPEAKAYAVDALRRAGSQVC